VVSLSAMTTWRFTGVRLPDGVDDLVEVGSGEVEELPGRYALTGLVDAHCHLTVASDDAGPYLADHDFGVRRPSELAASGVTVVRDVGGLGAVTLDFARAPEPGRPVVTAAGRFLSSPGRYFPRMYSPVDADELDRAIEAEVAAGAAWVKLIGDFPHVVDGVMQPDSTEPTYDLETVRRAIATAHAAGARVVVHTQSPYAADLIAAGADSIEHGTHLEPGDLAVLGSRGGAWTPTMSAVLALKPDATDRRRSRVAEQSERYAVLLPEAVRAGVRILAGSDVVGSVPAEVGLLVEHGLTPAQALDAATRSARDYLGVDPVGDLVTYAADPREHPEVLAGPAAVVVRGERVR